MCLGVMFLTAGLMAGLMVASALKPLPTDERGMNIHFSGYGEPNEVKMFGTAATIVRMDLHWDTTEPVKGEYNFTAFDELQDAMAAVGVRLWLILDYSNPIYCPNGTSPITPAQQDAFATWAAAAVSHFASRSSPFEPVYEIFNEPNGGFWKPKPNATQYSSMAVKAATAIRAKQPDAWVVGPTTAGIDLGFIQQTFENGLLDLIDAVTVHPYRDTFPETVQADYATLRSLIANYTPAGQDPKPIISSEWGWTTCQQPCTPPGPRATEDNQARFAVRRYLIDALQGVPISIDYDWRDGGNNPIMREQNFGGVESTYNPGNVSYPYEPKPKFFALRAFRQAVGEGHFVKRINATSPKQASEGIYALQYTASSGRDRVAAWGMGSFDSCPGVTDKVDCGFYGIGQDECTSRGCCFGPANAPGPQCYYTAQSTSINATFPAPGGPDACYHVTNYLGASLPDVCAGSTGNVTMELIGAPSYLVPATAAP